MHRQRLRFDFLQHQAQPADIQILHKILRQKTDRWQAPLRGLEIDYFPGQIQKLGE